MTLAEGFSVYRDYIVQRSFTGTWAAYAVGCSEAWFEAATKPEVLRQIDEALAEVPE